MNTAANSVQAHQISPGMTLLDRYKIEDVIGEGGFGKVFRATQISTGQSVAIKVLLADPTLDDTAFEEERGRFEREMRLIGRLNHPHVVKLIDSGFLGKSRFMVLEFIDGYELNEILEEHGPMEAQVVRRIMAQILDALAEAHGMGVIHRDLKPQNIMLIGTAPRFNVKVLDFGIAGVTEEAQDSDYKTLTQAGQIRGTPAYMSPEQIRFGETSAQSDLYAIGLIMLQCLTGRRAVTGDNVQDICIKQVMEPVPVPAAIAASPLGHIIARAAAKDPSERYPSAEAMLSDLEDVMMSGVIHIETGKLPLDLGIDEAAATRRFGNTPSVQLIDDDQSSLLFSQRMAERSAALRPADLAAVAQADPQTATPARNKTPLIVAALVVLLAIAGVVIAMSSKSDTPPPNEASSTASSADSAPTEPSTTPPQNPPTSPKAEAAPPQHVASNHAAAAAAVETTPEAKKEDTLDTPDMATLPWRQRVMLRTLKRGSSISAASGQARNDLKPLSIWHLTSTPPAQVMLRDNTELCATTPCQVILERPDKKLDVIFKASKHSNSIVALDIKGGSQTTSLSPIVRRKKKKRDKTKGKTQSSRSGSKGQRIDVF